MRSGTVGAITVAALALSLVPPTTASFSRDTIQPTLQLFERGRSPGSGGRGSTANYVAPPFTTMATSTTVKASAMTSTRAPEASETAEPYLETAAS